MRHLSCDIICGTSLKTSRNVPHNPHLGVRRDMGPIKGPDVPQPRLDTLSRVPHVPPEPMAEARKEMRH